MLKVRPWYTARRGALSACAWLTLASVSCTDWIAPVYLGAASCESHDDCDDRDATAYPGNSGSPVYRAQDGVVIGVINKVFVKSTKENVLKDPSGITYAIPIRYGRALIDKAKR